MSYPGNFYYFIAQVDEICSKCGKELPVGSRAWSDEDQEKVFCDDCMPDGGSILNSLKE